MSPAPLDARTLAEAIDRGIFEPAAVPHARYKAAGIFSRASSYTTASMFRTREALC